MLIECPPAVHDALRLPVPPRAPASGDPFADRLRRALNQARREGAGLALVVVHAPPRQVDLLHRQVRDTDAAAHRDDGRFVVLILGATPADARRSGQHVATRLEASSRAMTWAGDPLPAATVTVAGAGDTATESLLDRAGFVNPSWS